MVVSVGFLTKNFSAGCVLKVTGELVATIASWARTAVSAASYNIRREDATPHIPIPVSPMEVPRIMRNKSTASAEAPSSSAA